METLSTKKLSRLLSERLSKNSAYLEALGVARKNSEGKIWLIGGGVYKTLINALHNQSHNIKDWDFIVEKISKPLKPDDGWVVTETAHGNPRLRKDNFVIDLVALNNIHSIKQRNLDHNMANYLSGTPYTVQSIAFNVDGNELLGETGVNSVLNKTVGINNIAEYNYMVGLYGDLYSANDFAERLGFKFANQN